MGPSNTDKPQFPDTERSGKDKKKRNTKIASVDEVVSLIKSGCKLGLGGALHESRPVALLREVVKRRIGDLSVYSGPVAGYDVDLLIGAGLVKETFIPAITFESHGLAPNFREAVEGGLVKAHILDVLTVVGGLMAAALGLPFFPIAALKGTDEVKYNPLIKKFTPPFGDEDIYAVQPIAPDVVLLHAAESDPFGNIRNYGAFRSVDQLLAKAGKTVIVSVDKIVSPETIMQDPYRTTIPCVYIHKVVEIPYGAHPTASPSIYSMDDDHIAEYWQAAELKRTGRNPEVFNSYLRRYVDEPESIYRYLELVGGMRKLVELEKEERRL